MKLSVQCQVSHGLTEGIFRYPSYMRMDVLQGLFGWVWEISPRRAFELQTIQFVASRCTDNTISTHITNGIFWEKCLTCDTSNDMIFACRPECHSRYSASLRPGRSGLRIPVEARFSAPVQTGPVAHPTSYTMATGYFAGLMRPWRGVDYPPPSSVWLNKE
jgi:hypothetical protein